MHGQAKKRDQSIDVLRGLAIILVVAGHANRGAIDEKLSYSRLLNLIDYVIYSVHMPVFFYLSGYFCFASLNKRETLTFFRSRMRVIVRPYIIWSVITVAAGVVMSNFTYIRTPVRIMDLLQIGWKPIGVLWFLYALFAMQVAATLLWRRPVIALIGIIVLEAVVTGVVAGGGNELPTRIIAHAPFFFTGLLVASVDHRPLPKPNGNPLIYALLWSSVWLSGAYLFFDTGIASPVSLIVLPICAAGILALACVSTQLEGSGAGVLLAKLGRASMSIYLLHIFVLALVPRLLKLLSVDEAWSRIVFGTLIGVFGAYLLSIVLHRLRLSRPLGFNS